MTLCSITCVNTQKSNIAPTILPKRSLNCRYITSSLAPVPFATILTNFAAILTNASSFSFDKKVSRTPSDFDARFVQFYKSLKSCRHLQNLEKVKSCLDVFRNAMMGATVCVVPWRENCSAVFKIIFLRLVVC